MEVHLTPDLQAQLDRLSAETGRDRDELVKDAVAGYFAELAQAREMLDRRYDEVKSGKVQTVDGEDAFARIRGKSHERRSDRG
jgi:predicted transcriptional regulator